MNRDSNLPPMFLVRCIVAIRKFIILLYVIPNILFGVDGNSGATRRKLYMPMTNKENSQRQNIVGGVCSVFIHYLNLEKIVAAVYQNRDKSTVSDFT